MSGSSRALSRTIVSVFENWSVNKNWDKSPSQDIKDLNDTIYAYKERHNSLSSLNSSINHELRSTYSKYIKDSSDLSKEVLFLDLLTKLSAGLNGEEVKLWLATYLFPAIESTGFDIKFVNKARDFIRSVTIDLFPTDDPALRDRRQAIARMVVDYILRIYLGTYEEAYKLIGMEFEDASARRNDTHENIERIRFMERNCGGLLQEYGQQSPTAYFTLINQYFVKVEDRLKVLCLLSMSVSSYASRSKAIIDTPLFHSLLRCLSEDHSESIVASALSVLAVFMGKLCEQLSPYVSDLFLIYARLIARQDPGTLPANTTEEKKTSWLVAPPDMESITAGSILSTSEESNFQYFITVLYALFPSNLLRFSKNPSGYLKLQHPKVVVYNLESFDAENKLYHLTRDLCRQMRLHPNLVESVTLQEELRSPLQWISNEIQGGMSEDDVILHVLRLNPVFIMWLPDSSMLPKLLSEKIQEDVRTSNQQFSGDSSGSRQRGSNVESINTTVTSDSIEGTSTPRRSSIVPKKVRNEKSPNEPQIRFKTVDFSMPKPEDSSPRPINANTSTSEHDGQILELFSAHEKLYRMSSTRRNSLQSELQNPQVASGNFQTTTKSASTLLNEQLKGKKDEEQTVSKGSSLDFYQRELLLYKNEIEFILYMKELYKLSCIKLKIHNGELRRSLEKEGFKSSPKNADSKSHNALLIALEELQKSSQTKLASAKAENVSLSKRIIEIQSEIKILHGQLNDVQSIKDAALADLEVYKLSAGEMEVELERLKLKEKAESAKSEPQPYPKAQSSSPSNEATPFISEHEAELHSLHVELEMARSETSSLERKLKDAEEKMDLTVRGYEKQIANMKLDIGESVRKEVGHYLRKIQELESAIMKYSTSIEEKNILIQQLSTSKPIKIPGGRESEYVSSPVKPRNIPVPPRHNRAYEIGTPDQRGGRNMQEYFDTRSSSGTSMRSSTSAQSVQINPRPHTAMYRSPTTTSIPVIKGRGGYQKRSKKM
ncbi:hypothetical protein CJJ07_003435 [Candidozyma auris]|nr:hypothetical protein CJJ07_003435 [[Candida] auris]QEL61331.1 hypothetical protein CJJ09_003471 [[Candida] auris]